MARLANRWEVFIYPRTPRRLVARDGVGRPVAVKVETDRHVNLASHGARVQEDGAWRRFVKQ